MQMVAPCSCRMAKEHDVQMDVDMLKSQHNRLHSQLGQGGNLLGNGDTTSHEMVIHSFDVPTKSDYCTLFMQV